MNPADPRWLEILNATGQQNFGLSIAFAAFIFIVKVGVVPTTAHPLWITIPAIASLVCGGLALAVFGSSASKFISRYVCRRYSRYKYRKMVERFIPHMTEQDRTIIGYLLYHNQKTFQAISDGGYAAPLIGKGIIRIAAVYGQQLDMNQVPFEIPDDAWDVLVKARDEFPYEPPKDETETHPWAIPWMVK